MTQVEDQLSSGEEWFKQYFDRIERGERKTEDGLRAPDQNGPGFHCPCCGYLTLSERGGYEICPICDWEDDGQDDPHAEEVWGGPNGQYSLALARRNFKQHQTMYSESDRDRFLRCTSDHTKREKQRVLDELTAQGNSRRVID